MDKVVVAEKFTQFAEHWNPKVGNQAMRRLVQQHEEHVAGRELRRRLERRPRHVLDARMHRDGLNRRLESRLAIRVVGRG